MKTTGLRARLARLEDRLRPEGQREAVIWWPWVCNRSPKYLKEPCSYALCTRTRTKVR